MDGMEDVVDVSMCEWLILAKLEAEDFSSFLDSGLCMLLLRSSLVHRQPLLVTHFSARYNRTMYVALLPVSENGRIPTSAGMARQRYRQRCPGLSDTLDRWLEAS